MVKEQDCEMDVGLIETMDYFLDHSCVGKVMKLFILKLS